MTKNPLIAITVDTNSSLAKNSSVVLNSHVDIEICPNNLAPTNSTTAQLVIGDAIAATLVKINGFTSKIVESVCGSVVTFSCARCPICRTVVSLDRSLWAATLKPPNPHFGSWLRSLTFLMHSL